MATGQKSDLLYGVQAIADYLRMPRRTCQHRIDQGQIPTFRLDRQVTKGATICARERSLDAWLDSMEGC